MTKKKNIILIGIINIFLLVFPYMLEADSSTGNNESKNSSIKYHKAPLNSDFIKYRKSKYMNKVQKTFKNGIKLGYIPSPVDISHLKNSNFNIKNKTFPNVFDLRNTNRVSPIRNQGDFGTCWSFAALSSIESNFMPGENLDFSERALATNTGYDWEDMGGGNQWIASAILTRWNGPAKESYIPYTSIQSANKQYIPERHVQGVKFLPSRENYLDNNTIKHFVQQYGGIAISIHMSEEKPFYNKLTNSLYVNDKSLLTNHGVTMIGWDDNYSKNNFDTTPPGDGAFLIKNSWGDTWGNSGYFYVSYYDEILSNPVSYNFTQNTDNYGTLYMYDKLGWTESLGYQDTVAWGANIFTAINNQPLKAVSFFTNDSNVKYHIYIYRDVENIPKSGTLITEKIGTLTYSGYHTIPLNSLVNLYKDQKFSIIIRFENSNYKYPVVVEYPFDDYSSLADAEPNQSFISYEGISWDDLDNNDSNINTCIRGFTEYIHPKIEFNVSKITASSWTMKKEYVNVTLDIANIDEVSADTIILQKKEADSIFGHRLEVPVSALENGPYRFVDSNINKDTTYTYRLVIKNTIGTVIGISEEKTI